jgi:Methyltransferase domain
VLGIDLAAGMVEQLNAELTARGIGNAEARVGDAEDLDLPDGGFDVVTGGFMIFFPPDPPRVLLEQRRVLVPGGTLALSIFDGPSGFPWMDDIAAELFDPSPPMPSEEFDKAAVLDDALVAAGFTRPIALDVVERFRFADAGQVEAWMRSHGVRLLLERCASALSCFPCRADPRARQCVRPSRTGRRSERLPRAPRSRCSSSARPSSSLRRRGGRAWWPFRTVGPRDAQHVRGPWRRGSSPATRTSRARGRARCGSPVPRPVRGTDSWHRRPETPRSAAAWLLGVTLWRTPQPLYWSGCWPSVAPSGLP